MLFKFKLLIAVIIFGLVYFQAEARDSFPDGTDLASEVHDYYMGDNSIARMTMELVDRNDRSRMRQLITITMDDNNIRSSLIRFLEPADIAGTGFLSLEQGDGSTQQFLYLPALDRTRRIVSTQRGRSFVNSDFTYEDMERRPVDESEHIVTGEEIVDGRECWILEIRPLPAADSQYSLLKSWIPKEMAIPVKTLFFNQRGDHVKTYQVLSLEEVQGIWTPTHVLMHDLKQNHRTVLVTLEIEYNSSQIDPSFFSTRYLESW
ncbi:outer membrane lipoprotein-sorting protein [Desulfonatronovibrio hydrogenovorans]|uniref:outer membrane lipoprotein-sorting protein n=1 Tax=Desulfonatronovibrio hydrogenovorans TaxID=53245 RepID=UPI00068D1347|nr:outer membrane lipoprotein-sorting protein [Desulfonatronovibrio hydrogenovorans]